MVLSLFTAMLAGPVWAAPKPYTGPILTWTAQTGFAANNDPTDIDVKNEGKSNATVNLVSVEGIELVSLSGPFRVAPGTKLQLRVRWIEPCQDAPDAPPACGVGTATISGFGGDAIIRVEPLPSDMKHIGAPAARVWWNPDGPPPPLPPPAAVTALSNVSMGLANVPDPVRVSTKKGDLDVHVTAPDGITPEQAASLTVMLGAAFKTCAEARTKPFATEPETLTVAASWGSDGVITGVAADSGLGDKSGPPCLSYTLMGKPTNIPLAYSVAARAVSVPR